MFKATRSRKKEKFMEDNAEGGITQTEQGKGSMYYINKNVFGKVLFWARLFLLHTHTHIYTESQSHNVKFTSVKKL